MAGHLKWDTERCARMLKLKIQKKMRQDFLTRSSRAIERQNNIEAMILSSGVKENTLAVGAGAMARVVVAVLNAPRGHTFHLVSIKIDGGGWFFRSN